MMHFVFNDIPSAVSFMLQGYKPPWPCTYSLNIIDTRATKK